MGISKYAGLNQTGFLWHFSFFDFDLSVLKSVKLLRRKGTPFAVLQRKYRSRPEKSAQRSGRPWKKHAMISLLVMSDNSPVLLTRRGGSKGCCWKFHSFHQKWSPALVARHVESGDQCSREIYEDYIQQLPMKTTLTVQPILQRVPLTEFSRILNIDLQRMPSTKTLESFKEACFEGSVKTCFQKLSLNATIEIVFTDAFWRWPVLVTFKIFYEAEVSPLTGLAHWVCGRTSFKLLFRHYLYRIFLKGWMFETTFRIGFQKYL